MIEHLWIPDAKTIELAQSTQLARHLGLASYEELLAFSLAEPERFWDATAHWLELAWETPYTQVLDASRGPAWGRWFAGGRLNLAWSCVGQHAEGDRADQLALIAEREDGQIERRTYAELWDEIGRLALGLQALGVGVGDRVAIVLPMGTEAVTTLYATVRLGAIGVPIFSGFSAKAIAARLADCQVKVVVTSEVMLRRGKSVPVRETVEAAIAISPVEQLVVAGAETGDVSYERLIADRDGATCPTVWVDSEHPLFVCYTSGTTGKPKGAVHVHGGFLVKIAEEVRIQGDVRDGDRVMWFTDMGWIMGPWVTIGTHAAGQTMVCFDGAPDTPTPARLWEVAARHNVTFLGVSPTLIRALQPHGAELARAQDLSALRAFGSTGEPWNAEPYRWLFEEVGEGHRPIVNISGGTEVGACLLACDVTIPLSACSLGRPALGMQIDVFGPAGNSLTDAVGELVCKGPWPAMTRGLWNDNDRYVESYWSHYPDVWTHGDWATRHADGSWLLHGRSDDTLNIAGKRVGPAEFESALVSDPAVMEACAVGVPHPVKGEAVHCFVVLTGGGELDEETVARLRLAVERELGPAFRPERIVAVTDLPKTRSQKIVRRAVRAALVGEDPGDLSTLENPSSLEAIRALST